MMTLVVLFAAIFTVVAFLRAFAILAAIHLAIIFFAAVLTIVAFLCAFAVLAAIHLAIGFFAAVLTVVAFHGAFAVFAAIHGFFRGSTPVVLAAAMQFIISGCGSFEPHIIIPHIGYLLLDLCGVSRAALVCYGKLFCVNIPGGILSPGFFGRFFDLGFAHAAITGNFECFCLCLGYSQAGDTQHAYGH
jgi:hypothetical protein